MVNLTNLGTENIKLKMDKDEELDKYNYDLGNYYNRIESAYEYANRNSINNN